MFQPGAVGEPSYSPLIARDANGDGRIELFTEAADKVVAIDIANRSVTFVRRGAV